MDWLQFNRSKGCWLTSELISVSGRWSLRLLSCWTDVSWSEWITTYVEDVIEFGPVGLSYENTRNSIRRYKNSFVGICWRRWWRWYCWWWWWWCCCSCFCCCRWWWWWWWRGGWWGNWGGGWLRRGIRRWRGRWGTVGLGLCFGFAVTSSSNVRGNDRHGRYGSHD